MYEKWLDKIKVIIWDVDGTFYQYTDKIRNSCNGCIVEKVSKHLDIEIGEAKKIFWQKYYQIHSHTLALDELGLDGKAVTDECFQQKIPGFLKKDERLIEMFSKLSNYDHYILTNSKMVDTENKLQALGVKKSFFKGFFNAFEMEFVKPDVRVYEEVLKKIDVRAENCLMVGDRVDTDLVPAMKVGMRSCLVWDASTSLSINEIKVDVSLESVYEISEMMRRG